MFVGLQPRDDDIALGYSAVVYIYNDILVKISAPVQGNQYLGSIVYTGITFIIIDWINERLYLKI